MYFVQNSSFISYNAKYKYYLSTESMIKMQQILKLSSHEFILSYFYIYEY